MRQRTQPQRRPRCRCAVRQSLNGRAGQAMQDAGQIFPNRNFQPAAAFGQESVPEALPNCHLLQCIIKLRKNLPADPPAEAVGFSSIHCKGYLAKLLGNARIVRYLAQHQQELLSEFQKIAELESAAA